MILIIIKKQKFSYLKGIKRSWSGYPRLVYNPNKKIESCACVNDNDLDHPNIKEYPKCDKRSTICHLA